MEQFKIFIFAKEGQTGALSLLSLKRGIHEKNIDLMRLYRTGAFA